MCYRGGQYNIHVIIILKIHKSKKKNGNRMDEHERNKQLKIVSSDR